MKISWCPDIFLRSKSFIKFHQDGRKDFLLPFQFQSIFAQEECSTMQFKQSSVFYFFFQIIIEDINHLDYRSCWCLLSVWLNNSFLTNKNANFFLAKCLSLHQTYALRVTILTQSRLFFYRALLVAIFIKWYVCVLCREVLREVLLIWLILVHKWKQTLFVNII